MNDYQEPRSGAPLAIGLGCFSIGLGLAEVLAPRALARLIGAGEDDRTAAQLRTLGAREIGTGLAILAQPARPAWMWSRVGGDAIDLAWLGNTAPDRGNDDRSRLGAAAAAVLGVTALDILCAQQLSRQRAAGGEVSPRVRVHRQVTIRRPIEDVYAFWRRFENLPRFMRHLDEVQELGNGRSRWTAIGPGGVRVTWDAAIERERRNELIAWRSLPGAFVAARGLVRFTKAPADRGTEVRVHLEYVPPAGHLGKAVATMLGREPSQQVGEDLHRFKQLMEAGEVPLSDGLGLWRAAQPAASTEEITNLAGVR
jgi:uncharacterized membrane protein